MKQGIKVLAGIVLLASICATAARADVSQREVDSIAASIRNGEGVDKSWTYPVDYAQLVSFCVGPSCMISYVVDLRTKMCFVRSGQIGQLSIVSCKAVKEGYPLLAPLIPAN